MKKKKGVLITGASRGIGRAAALLLARYGFHLFLNSAHHLDALKEVQKEILRLPGASCELCPGNVGDPGQVRNMFSQISRSEQVDGGVEILINNAGISHIGLLMDMTDSEWNQVIATNLSSAFLLLHGKPSRTWYPKKTGKSYIISSMWGRSGASCEAAYSASKAGIHGLTQALAKELAPSNIQVNAIAFGVIDTAMNQMLDPDERLALQDEIPAGRFAAPEEAAQMILHVLQAPSYMTGQIMDLTADFYRNCRHKYIRKRKPVPLLIGTWFPFLYFCSYFRHHAYPYSGSVITPSSIISPLKSSLVVLLAEDEILLTCQQS